MLVEITEKQLIMSEGMLKYATNEEIQQIRTICRDVADRAKAAKAEMRKGGATTHA